MLDRFVTISEGKDYRVHDYKEDYEEGVKKESKTEIDADQEVKEYSSIGDYLSDIENPDSAEENNEVTEEKSTKIEKKKVKLDIDTDQEVKEYNSIDDYLTDIECEEDAGEINLDIDFDNLPKCGYDSIGHLIEELEENNNG